MVSISCSESEGNCSALPRCKVSCSSLKRFDMFLCKDYPALGACTKPLKLRQSANRLRTCLLVVVDIDDGLLPLAGRDLPLEHDVDLAV